MPLVNMSQMLMNARAGKYAIGAFNILDYNSMKAVIETAVELNAPVIVQTSEKTVRFWGFKPMITWFRELGENSPVPVAIHLDHCKNLEFIKNCIDAGWTSVMIDASSKPFEENLELTRKVVEMSKPYGVSVEAELGEISGVEEDIIVNEKDAHLCDPEKARIFLENLNIDFFAPAIGTAHGVYKGKPKIAYDRLEIISKMTTIPLALHGGTGLSEEVFKKSIALGCSKVNISTQLKYAFIDGFVRYYNANPNEYNPLPLMGAQYELLKQAVKENILLFGSTQKA